MNEDVNDAVETQISRIQVWSDGTLVSPGAVLVCKRMGEHMAPWRQMLILLLLLEIGSGVCSSKTADIGRLAGEGWLLTFIS